MFTQDVLWKYGWIGIITVPLLAVLLNVLFKRAQARSKSSTSRPSVWSRSLGTLTCPKCEAEVRVQQLRTERRGLRTQFHCPSCSTQLVRDRKSTTLMIAGIVGLTVGSLALPVLRGADPILRWSNIGVSFLSIVLIFWSIGVGQWVSATESDRTD